MVGIGVLIPDDGLEDYIRQAGHLPGKTYEMMREERKQQQESNQPPESGPFGDVGSDAEGDGGPDEKTDAAKRRLGRETGI